MASKDYFVVSVATNNAEKKKKQLMTKRVKLPTISSEFSQRTIK